MNVLITAGNSFIARNLQEQLKHNFVAPTHQELDLLDEKAVDDFFKDKQFDCVIHTASICGRRRIPDGEDIFYQNIAMFEGLLRNEDHFNKLINIGSGAEYGFQLPLVDVKENFERVPEDFYGMAKQVVSKTIERLDWTVNLRFFGVFGKYEKTTRLIPTLLREKNPIIQNCFFSYCYIDDAVKIIDWFIKNDSEYSVYNVSGTKIKLSDIAKKLKVKAIITNSGVDYTCDDSRLRKELDFKYSNFDKSLEEYAEWLKLQS